MGIPSLKINFYYYLESTFYLCFCLLKQNNSLRVNGKITLNDFEKKGATIIVSIVLSGNHQEGALATRYCGAWNEQNSSHYLQTYQVQITQILL